MSKVISRNFGDVMSHHEHTFLPPPPPPSTVTQPSNTSSSLPFSKKTNRDWPRMSKPKDDGGKSSSSKVMLGIKHSGGNVMSGIKSGKEKVASGGSKAMSGIGKGVHAISSPIESAVRKTVDKANDSLHGGNHSSHSTSSSTKEASQGETSHQEGSATDTEVKKTTAEPVSKETPATLASETTVAPPQSQETPAEAGPTTEADAASNDSKHGLLGSVESVTNKILVAPVKGVVGKVTEGGNKLLVNPARDVSKKAKEALHIKSKSGSRELDADKEQDVDLPNVPPDDTLKKMNVIINKQLKNVSVQDYYATAWSEGDGTKKPPLYGPWLKESGKQEISVGKWEFADANTDFVGDWDGEKYRQKRVSRILLLLVRSINFVCPHRKMFYSCLVL